MDNPDVAAATVLFVDDDPELSALLRQTLADDGHRLLTERDPRRALPAIEWENVDVVVADIRIDFLTRARELFPDVPRVVVTSTSDFSVAVKAINEAQIFALLGKPPLPGRLRQTVRDAIRVGKALKRARAAKKAIEDWSAFLQAQEARWPGVATLSPAEAVHVLDELAVGRAAARLQSSAIGRFA